MASLSIVELPPFSRQLNSVLSESEYDALRDYMKANPRQGVVIRGTGAGSYE